MQQEQQRQQQQETTRGHAQPKHHPQPPHVRMSPSFSIMYTPAVIGSYFGP